MYKVDHQRPHAHTQGPLLPLTTYYAFWWCAVADVSTNYQNRVENGQNSVQLMEYGYILWIEWESWQRRSISRWWATEVVPKRQHLMLVYADWHNQASDTIQSEQYRKERCYFVLSDTEATWICIDILDLVWCFVFCGFVCAKSNVRKYKNKRSERGWIMWFVANETAENELAVEYWTISVRLQT